jgi:nicotinamide mononucleotide transporter
LIMGTFYDWAFANWVEVCGTAAGLIYLWFSVRQSILTWPAGLLTSLLYIWIFFSAKFYAGMGLQFYYVVISIYGWWSWLNGTPDNSGERVLHVSRTGMKLWMWLFTINLLLFVLIAYILVNFTDSPIPYWDAFTTSLSIIATWMLARKKFEHWLLWMLIDTISIGLYIYRELYPTTILFIAYTIMAVVGYFEWRKDLKTLECRVKSV